MYTVKGYYLIREEAPGIYAMQCGPFSYVAVMNELGYFRDAHPDNTYKIIYTDIVGELLIA